MFGLISVLYKLCHVQQNGSHFFHRNLNRKTSTYLVILPLLHCNRRYFYNGGHQNTKALKKFLNESFENSWIRVCTIISQHFGYILMGYFEKQNIQLTEMEYGGEDIRNYIMKNLGKLGEVWLCSNRKVHLYIQDFINIAFNICVIFLL